MRFLYPLALWCPLALEMGAGQAWAVEQPKGPEGGDKPADAASVAGWAWVDDLVYQRTSSIGLLAVEGIDPAATSFHPTRELHLSDKSKLVLGRDSLIWNVRAQINRNAFTAGHGGDDPYASGSVTLPNGSVIGRDRQFTVQEGYYQHLRDNWILQLGAQQFAWGTADSINPLAVFNPPDLRAGVIGDKETKVAPIPAARLALLDGGSTLNIVYAPWRRAALIAGPGQNWYITPDNLAFNLRIEPEERVENAGSWALKYDQQIANGDLSFLYYNGADYSFMGIPQALVVENNQPLVVDIVQTVPNMTAVGGAYSQTFGQWVLKAEGLYTINKKGLPEIDRARIQDQQFPLMPRTSPHVQTTVGVNYFASTKSFFGIPLGDTVLTAEYFHAQYMQKQVASPFFSDVLLANIRTSTMEDRLEGLFTYIVDVAKQGQSWNAKLTFSGEMLRHSLSYTGFNARTPDPNQVGSVFYYWRNKAFAAYDVVYPF